MKPKAVKPTPAKPAAAKPAAAKPATTKPATTKSATTKSAAAKPAAADAGSPFQYKATNSRESEIYGERLDGLQTEVNALKDKIFRSKARLRCSRRPFFAA
ncbi:MAG: hypothetical protein JKY37_12075 [Nannocystaceae bacterium]|nr:hypothetical protein [Nannocystaceae bacterium]